MEEKKPFLAMSDDIQAKLDKKLGPEYISKRVGFGTSRVAYIEGWKAINLANQIFGYNGWSTEVKNVVIDFLDERQGKFSIGCTAIVRVTLANGTHREDIGYGTVENERRKSAAFERAKKSAVTDALKRSLRSFGNALGNCLYDKDFLSKIDRVKFDPPDFDEGNLFRPSDEISEISRSNTLDSNNDNIPALKRRQLTKIGMNPPANQVKSEPSNKLIANPPGQQQGQQTIEQEHIHLNNGVPGNMDTVPAGSLGKDEELLDDSFMFSDDFQDDDLMNMGEIQDAQIRQDAADLIKNKNQLQASNDPVTFVTAKAATTLQTKEQVSDDNVFDPKFQAQSFRHTIDQSTSTHIPASAIKNIGKSRDSIYEKFAPKGKQLNATKLAPQVANSVETANSVVHEGIENKNPNSNPNVSTIPTTIPKEITDSSIPTPVKVGGTAIFSPTPAAMSLALTGTMIQNVPHFNNPTIMASPKYEGTSKYAPPTTVVHPNSFAPPVTSINLARREVGRPKINPLQARKPSS